MDRSVALNNQSVFSLGGEDTRGKNCVAVVDENLDRTAVYKNAQVKKSLGQRTGSLFALLCIEAPFQSGAVNGYLSGTVILGNGHAAGTSRGGKQLQRHISASADKLYFTHTRKQIG